MCSQYCALLPSIFCLPTSFIRSFFILLAMSSYGSILDFIQLNYYIPINPTMMAWCQASELSEWSGCRWQFVDEACFVDWLLEGGSWCGQKSRESWVAGQTQPNDEGTKGDGEEAGMGTVAERPCSGRHNCYGGDKVQAKQTGQLTIMAHPTQIGPYSQPHYAPYNPPSYDQHSRFHHSSHQPARQPQRSSQSKQEERPSFARCHAEQCLQFDRKDREHNESISRQPRQEKQEEEKEKEALSARVQRLEQALSENIKFINTQTLESFYDLRTQIFNRITAYDQSFHERTQKLASLENNWQEKSKQILRKQEAQIQQEGEKLFTLRQKLDRDMKKQVEDLLEEERSQANRIRQQKFDELALQLEKHRTQRKQEILQLEDQIQTLKEEEQNARDGLEERIHLRIKDETQAKEVLSNKVADLQERTEGVEELQEMKDMKRKKEIEKEKEIKRKEEMEKERKLMEEVQEIQRKGEFEKLVDMETPHAARFLIQANNITYNQQGDGNFYQVLLGVVLGRTRPFVLHAHITNKNGHMAIGVVDRLTQRQERYSSESGNAVCYYSGYGSCIQYGHYGKHKQTKTGIELKTGDKLRVEVDLDRGMATFSIGDHKFTQHSDILSQPHRQFVPFFEMCRKGNSIVWRIE